MNLRRNLLATAITSLLCFSQTALAEPVESTVILNGVGRTMTFANQEDANSMVTGQDANGNPLPKNILGEQAKLFIDSNGLPATTTSGLVSQTELNGVPVTTIKVSGAVAVIAQPQADGSTGFFTLTSVKPDGTAVGASLSSLISSYAAAVKDPAHADPLLASALYQGVTKSAAALANTALTSIATAEFKAPVDVATGGTPAENTDPAVLLKSLLLQQTLINNAAAVKAPTTGGLKVTTIPDLTAITQSTLVQLNVAAANTKATATVAANVANDPALASLAQAALASAQSAEVSANLDFLNDPTVTKTDAQITASLTSIVTNNLAILNSSAANMIDKEAAKSNLDALLAKYPTNSYLLGQATAIQTAQTVFANDKSIAAEVAILNSATATQAEKAAALQALKAMLGNTSLTASQIAQIQSDLATYGVPAAVTNALAVLNGTVAGNKAAALKTLEKAYDQAMKDAASTDALKKISAQAVLDAIGGKVAAAELSTANSALSSATQGLKNTTTAGQIINARQALKTAETAAVKSTKYVDASSTAAAAAGTASLSAAQIQAQAQTALANTSTSEYFARHTAANGIAGNPSSMLNMTADHMFTQAADVNNMTSIASGTTAGGMQHSINAGVQYNYYNLAGTNVNTVSLPLSYTAQLNSKSQVIVSVPLSYISQNQNDTYQVGGGLALKYNVTNNWTLTPAFSYAYRTVGSTNYSDYYAKRALGDGVSVAGGGLTSKYDWTYNDIKISLTNMGGYFSVADGFGATPANAIGYSNDLGSMVVKNGISLGKSVAGFGVTTYLNDAEYFGSKLFFDQYNEFGFALRPENMGALNAFSLNANYLFSFKGGKRGDLDGFKLNLNYKF